MEATIDLERCLKILADTRTSPSIHLNHLIGSTYQFLGESEKAGEYRDRAFEKAIATDNDSALCWMIETEMQQGIQPDWETYLLPKRRRTSVISTLAKVAEWFFENGDSSTANKICREIETVGMSYSAGAAIGSDGMRVMRSDIWGQLMSARAWAAAGNFDRSVEIVSDISEYHRYEAMRLVARLRASEPTDELQAWFDSLPGPEMQAYAMLGVLEQRRADSTSK